MDAMQFSSGPSESTGLPDVSMLLDIASVGWVTVALTVSAGNFSELVSPALAGAALCVIELVIIESVSMLI